MHIRVVLALIATCSLSACAGAVRAPAAVEVDGYRIEVQTTSLTERLNFELSTAKTHGTVAVRVTVPKHDGVDRFGTPTPTIVSIICPRGCDLMKPPSDGKRLDVKISDAMQPSASREPPISSFGFNLERPVSHLALVRGVLETARVVESTIIDVPLDMMSEFHEVAERCRVRTTIQPAAENRVRIGINLEVDVNDASREMPNVPRKVEVIADDGSILGEPRTVRGSSGKGRITRQLLLDVKMPDGRKAAAIRLHLVTRAEWREHAFEFRNVPMRGQFAPSR